MGWFEIKKKWEQVVSGEKNNLKCPAIRTSSIFGKMSAYKNNIEDVRR